ncbi:MAG: SMP-30/gluconolactonase/LRE family protein, partial [Spirochaetaceae bacterium]|nr:SMP-30/gluconolactonase/LRE family protein [Spirochaetaceae bacterium]
AVDRAGRIVAGTMNFMHHVRPDGRLFRLDADLSLKELDAGLSVANGIGFSPDGQVMYVSEQFAGRILAYDYDAAAGKASRKRLFAAVPKEKGLPDGIIVDSEGFVWNGRWGGATIARYSPDGELDREYELPVETGTCLAFGGEDMKDLFITTAWYGLGQAGRAAAPHAGDLFVIRTGIEGTIEPRFAG